MNFVKFVFILVNMINAYKLIYMGKERPLHSNRDENILLSAITNQGTAGMINAFDAAGIISVAVRQEDPKTAFGMLKAMAGAGCGFGLKAAQFDNPVDGIVLRVEVDFKGIPMVAAGWGLPNEEAGGVPDSF
jgi:hypothetical protein